MMFVIVSRLIENPSGSTNRIGEFISSLFHN